MKPRTAVIIMVISFFVTTLPLLFFIYICINTPSLWGARYPIIYLGIAGFVSGLGFAFFTIGTGAAFLATRNRIKKELERRKILEIYKKGIGK